MLKLFCVLGLFMGLTATAKAGKIKTLVLEDYNTVALRGPVTADSASKVQVALIRLSATLPKNSKIYLVLDTPGGSVTAGMELVQTIKSLPQKVISVVNFAASMGFVITQNSYGRFITPNGTLMAHRAFVTLSGQLPGELDSRKEFIETSISDIEKDIAVRLKMSHGRYNKLIMSEFWISGKRAKDQNMVDLVVNVRCGKSLVGEEKEKIETFFGPVTVTMSSCPMVGSPIAVNFSEVSFESMSPKEEAGFRSFILMMYSDKSGFVREYIVPNKPLVYLR